MEEMWRHIFMRIFLDLMWFFKQEKKAYLVGILLLSVVAFLQMIPPKIIGLVVDEIQAGKLTKSSLIVWCGVLVITALLMYWFRYIWRTRIFGTAVKLTRQLRKQIYDHLTNMSQSFYQKYRTGDLMAHATNDLNVIQMTAGGGVLTLVDSLTIGGFVIVAMAVTISWKLTLISLIPMPLVAVLTNLYGKQLHQRFRGAQEAFSALNDKTQESISGIKVIKTFGLEQEDIASFREQSDDVVEKNLRVARIDSLYDPTISTIVGISFFLAISFGAKFVLNGELTIGQLITFTAYLGLLIWPMLAFGRFFNIVERGRASYERITKLLQEEADITDHPTATTAIPSGDITYNIPSFTYHGEKSPMLKNIYFTVKEGHTIGIVGKTGSGKTTLLTLLIRENDVNDGEITFGGVNINQFKINSLRSVVGYVPQEHFLFSTTIAENIAFANPKASKEKVMEVAQAAQIHDEIIQFPDGYDTIVGERGVSLSGGQRQRISIARALLMEPEVLVLDDSLSAVDANTEEAILTALKGKRSGKTTFITAHRLSAIQHADLILVLDDGEVIQSGSHHELMDEDGWYKKMFLQQQLEDLVEQGGK